MGHVTRIGAALAAFALAFGCGGDGKEADEPDDVVYDDDDDDESGGDVLIPEEKFIEIQAFFDRKRNLAARCWGEALEAGEVDANIRGEITLTMTITQAGKPTDVEVSKSNARSDTLERCLFGMIEGWTITTLPRPLAYSYTFAFDRL